MRASCKGLVSLSNVLFYRRSCLEAPNMLIEILEENKNWGQGKGNAASAE